VFFTNIYCFAANIEKPLEAIKKHLIRRKTVLSIVQNADDKIYYKTKNYYSEEWIKVKYFRVIKNLKFYQIPKLISITIVLIKKYGLDPLWILKPLKEKLNYFQINMAENHNSDFTIKEEIKKLDNAVKEASCKYSEPMIVPIGYNQGLEALRNKKYDLAIIKFQEALVEYENEIDRLQNLSSPPENYDFLIENYNGQITFVIEIQASFF
jgi:hypothetical protein